MRGLGKRLPVEFEGELELAGVEGRTWLAGGANGTCRGIAKLVHRCNVGAVEEVEGVGDEIEPEAFAEADALGDAEIELEKSRRCESVATESSEAAIWRRDTGDRERLFCIC